MALNLIPRFVAWMSGENSSLAVPSLNLRDAFGGGQRSTTGRVVNKESAMRISAAYACVRVLSEVMGSLPLTLYRRQGNNVEPATDHPLYHLMKSLPNPEMTSQDLRGLLVVNLCLRGTAFHQIVRKAGHVTEINPLQYDWIAMRRDDAGKLIYEYRPPTDAMRTFQAEDIWRVPGMSFNGLQGLTPLSYAREAMGVALSAEEQGARMFRNGLQGNVFLSIPGTPAPDKLDAMESRLEHKYGGVENAGRPAILTENGELKRISLSAVDAQLLENRKFSIAEVARFYGVPLHLIAELDRSTNNNIEHQGMEFVMYTLLSLGTRIEQSFMRDLLLPSERKAGYYLKHSFAGLLRGDTAARYAAYRSAVGGPWMTPNEPRAFEEMNPIEGGDKLYPPTNMGGDPKSTSNDSGEGKV